MHNLLFIPLAAALLAILAAFARIAWIRKQEPGAEKLQTIAGSR